MSWSKCPSSMSLGLRLLLHFLLNFFSVSSSLVSFLVLRLVPTLCPKCWMSARTCNGEVGKNGSSRHHRSTWSGSIGDHALPVANEYSPSSSSFERSDGNTQNFRFARPTSSFGSFL